MSHQQGIDFGSLPPATPNPCNDCPWVRTSIPGWLGPHTPQEWTDQAHGEVPIACHQTIVADEDGVGDWNHPKMRQCRGAAIYRANVCKSPHREDIAVGPVNKEAVFARRTEFEAHHEVRIALRQRRPA